MILLSTKRLLACTLTLPTTPSSSSSNFNINIFLPLFSLHSIHVLHEKILLQLFSPLCCLSLHCTRPWFSPRCRQADFAASGGLDSALSDFDMKQQRLHWAHLLQPTIVSSPAFIAFAWHHVFHLTPCSPHSSLTATKANCVQLLWSSHWIQSGQHLFPFGSSTTISWLPGPFTFCTWIQHSLLQKSKSTLLFHYFSLCVIWWKLDTTSSHKHCSFQFWYTILLDWRTWPCALGWPTGGFCNWFDTLVSLRVLHCLLWLALR